MDWLIRQKVNLSKGFPEVCVWPKALMVVGDNNAHVWSVEIEDDSNNPVDLSGWSIQGNFVRADDVTIIVSGSFSGNLVSVRFTEGCYKLGGTLRGILRAVKGDKIITISEVYFTVRQKLGEGTIDPDNILPSVSELNERCKIVESGLRTLTQTVSENTNNISSLGQNLKKKVFSNPNILINADFTNPVNQRGESSYNSGASIDVWKLWYMSASVKEGYIELGKDTSSPQANGAFFQNVEGPDYRGEIVTLTVEMSDGTKYIETRQNNSDDVFPVGSGTGIQYKIEKRSQGGIQFNLYAGNLLASSYKIKRIKLELGEHSTLHLDPQADYSVEYLKCLRYFHKMQLLSPIGYIFGELVYFTSPINFPVQMRVAPTIRVSSATIYQLGNVNFMSANSSVSKNGVAWLGFGKPSNAPATLTALNYLQCQIEFDAEL